MNRKAWVRLIPGIALCAAVAGVAMESSQIAWLTAHGLSALSVAIVAGIIMGNTVYAGISTASDPGVGFSKQTLLRAGVVLYGWRLTLNDVSNVGSAGVLIDAFMVASTFGLAWLLGTRLLAIDRTTSMLIGAGSAICGAAAVMATEPVVRGKTEQVAVAIASVVVFGTLAIFLYPALYALNLHWAILPGGQQAFGVYAGSTIHEVAQVFAAGRSVSVETADTAVITKMVRVMMLAPFLVGLSAWLTREPQQPTADAHRDAQPKRALPWFAFGFIAVVVLNSLLPLPRPIANVAISIDTFLLAMAMAALGLTTHISAIRRAGARPLVLAALLFVWLIAGGALINRFVWMYLH
jgi:uncharacterized integral membrane protein (TIGR00698 family)